jgi:hypothetical protein
MPHIASARIFPFEIFMGNRKMTVNGFILVFTKPKGSHCEGLLPHGPHNGLRKFGWLKKDGDLAHFAVLRIKSP